jgi:hypothetical protein
VCSRSCKDGAESKNTEESRENKISLGFSGSDLPHSKFLFDALRGSHVEEKILYNYVQDQASTTYFPFLSIESNMALASSSVVSPWAFIASFSDFLTSLGMFLADPEINMLAP